MADVMRRCGKALRPHVKAHKSPHIARLQMSAGAVGICAATVWEAAVMARFGIEDILVANQVVGWEKTGTLLNIAHRARVMVVVDNAANVRELARAAAGDGLTLDVLVEVDIGMGRAGVRSPRDAVELASQVKRWPSLQFCGVQGYEGHCMTVADSATRTAMVRQAHGELSRAVEALEQAGHPCSIVSAGGTGTCYLTGRNPLLTELQAGSYALMDSLHHALVPDFELAMTVLATVQSRHGSRVIVDLIWEKGISGMRYSISDTAEYGDLTRGSRIIDDHVRTTMRGILDEVRSGEFAREWILENQAGRPVYKALKRQGKQQLTEQVGKELRAMMPFIDQDALDFDE